MTYLDLINAVLVRLREEKISQAQWDADNDPYWRFIGSAVNDAKARVEDAWQWSALRGSDEIPLTPSPPLESGDYAVNWELPDSADNHYIVKGFYMTTATDKAFRQISWVSKQQMINRYSNGTPPVSTPYEVAVTRRSETTGNITVSLYPTPEDTDVLLVNRVTHQQDLLLATDRLKVPSLPVYTLATALASRERGEVGGTPTSELFSIADRHLGDAIATDSALFADELDWWANTDESNTNIRFA
jgi:hypothetical protein